MQEREGGRRAAGQERPRHADRAHQDVAEADGATGAEHTEQSLTLSSPTRTSGG